MKRILALILAMIMLSSTLIGCGQIDDGNRNDEAKDDLTENVTESEPMSFKAGYGRAKCTPTFSVVLGGSGVSTPTNMVYNDLFVSSTAIKDEEGKVLLILSADAHFLYDETCDTLRAKINEATGVPIENILINFTHTHYSPNFVSNKEAYALLEEASVNAAKVSIADLAPADIYIGQTETDELVFLRRFVDKDGDSKLEPEDGETETEPNETLYLIKFEREEKKDIVLANFASHATLTGAQKISADYIGVAREVFESTYCTDAYLSIQMGACGDAIAWEWTQKPYGSGKLVAAANFKGIEDYGNRLAKYTAEALPTLKKHETTKGIEVSTKELSLVVDHSLDSLKNEAARIVNEWDTNPTLAQSLLKKHNITSKEEAGAIWRKADLPAFNKMELSTVSIGNIAIVAAPYEMFTDTGRDIREASEYEFTFVLGYTNGFHYYIPTEIAFDNGGYEVTNCNYVKGSAEKIESELVKMLEKLYK